MGYENKDFYIDCCGTNIHAKLEFPDSEKEKLPVLVLIPGFTGHIEERHIIAVAEAAIQCGMAVLRAELYGHGKSGGNFYDHNVLIWMMPETEVCSGSGFDNETLTKEIQDPDWILSSDYVRAARMLPVDEAIKAYKGPVLVVHGTEDEAVPYRYGKELAYRYENATIIYEITEHTIDKHGQYLIVPDIELNTYWTNLPLADQEIIDIYHAHGESEQYHSEIKTYMDVERLPSCLSSRSRSGACAATGC